MRHGLASLGRAQQYGTDFKSLVSGRHSSSIEIAVANGEQLSASAESFCHPDIYLFPSEYTCRDCHERVNWSACPSYPR